MYTDVNMDRNQAFCVALVIFLLQTINIQHQQMVALFMLYERLINYQQTLLNIAAIRRRNRRLRRQRIAPYAWTIPRPVAGVYGSLLVSTVPNDGTDEGMDCMLEMLWLLGPGK